MRGKKKIITVGIDQRKKLLRVHLLKRNRDYFVSSLDDSMKMVFSMTCSYNHCVRGGDDNRHHTHCDDDSFCMDSTQIKLGVELLGYYLKERGLAGRSSEEVS